VRQFREVGLEARIRAREGNEICDCGPGGCVDAIHGR
jgi:hypothetical protein